MSTTAERGRLNWPKNLRKRIHPWQGLVEAKAPKPNLKSVFKRLKEVRKIAGKIKPSDSPSKFKARILAAVERLDSLEDGAFTSPETEAVAAVLMGMVDPAWPRGDEIGQDLVHLWAQQGGVVEAAETMFELWKLEGCDGWVKDCEQTLFYPKAYTALRSYLGTCPADQYQEALTSAQKAWGERGLLGQCLLAYLFPDQKQWVQEAASQWLNRGSAYGNNYQLSYIGLLLVASVEERELLEKLAQAVGAYGHRIVVDYLPTAVARNGSQAENAVATILSGCPDAACKKKTVAALGVIATEFSFSTLVPWLKDKTVCGLVSEALMAAPELAIPCLQRALAESTQGSAPLRTTLETLLAAQTSESGAQPKVELDKLPPVLSDPPWKRKAKRVKRPKVDPLDMVVESEEILWQKGDDWHLKIRAPFQVETSKNLAIRIERSVRSGDCQFQSDVLRMREEHNPLKILNESPVKVWNPYGLRGDESTPLRLLKKFGTDCIPALVKAVAVAPREFYGALSRLRSARVAPIMAEALARRKQQKKLARHWLLKHPKEAAFGLLPDALCAKGKQREHAELAILYLHQRGHTSDLRGAAQVYGQAACSALEVLLSLDPLDTYPKIKPLPSWFRPQTLPAPELKSGGALPVEVTEHVATILSVSPLDDPYAGLEQVKESCTEASLEAFAWALFSAWELAGADTKHEWALNALGHLGSDHTVRKLTPLVRRWPGEGYSKRATLGLQVLAAIGSDLALMHLYGISQKIRFKALQKKAVEMIHEIAEQLGLSTEELGDRLVPDLGLDTKGSLELDFGTRKFTVGFSECLVPFVLDEEKQQRKALPKPNKSDDPEKSVAATKLWRAMKKDAKSIAKNQLERLERAMSTQRRWSATDFHRLLLDHPLLIHLVRRLVWGIYADGKLLETFRVAEDGTLANKDEEAIESRAQVGIAHPLEFESEIASWQTLFADYQLLQPFPQLSRETYKPSEEELRCSQIARTADLEMNAGEVLGLERKGWHRGYVDSGCLAEMNRRLASGKDAVLSFDPGVYLAEPSETPTIHPDAIKLPDGMKIQDLHPVEFSELLYAVTP